MNKEEQKIRSPEEILHNTRFFYKYVDADTYHEEMIVEAMKEYAAQCIKYTLQKAAKEAKPTAFITKESEDLIWWDKETVSVDRKSITSLEEIIKKELNL